MTTGLEGETADLATWLRNDAAAAASRWASIVTGLESCKGTTATVKDDCPANTDGSVVKIVLGICDNRQLDACYLASRDPRDDIPPIENKLTGVARIVFKANPPGFIWTDQASLDGTLVERPGVPDDVFYKWHGNVLVHEFGHAFGLRDRDEPTGMDYDPYTGIMKTLVDGSDTIMPDDEKALIAIYKTHIQGEGW